MSSLAEKPGILDHWVNQLRERGMTPEQIEILIEIPDSQRGCSMHELLELLAHGCPPEIAFDIAS